MSETHRDAEQFLHNKHAAKRATNADNPDYVEPKLIRLESKESSKVSSIAKGAITCIDWSIDGS